MSPLIHYHGTPITPREVLLRLGGRSFCVPFSSPRDVSVAHEIGEGVMLDNGAFTAWTSGKATDWPGYYAWCEPWLDYPTTWAVIPDVIGGSEEENDRLIAQWPHGQKGSPVWHMHESIDRFLSLAERWPRICIGSSAEFSQVGSPQWTSRIEDALNALCGNGPVPVWLHMLRGLSLCGSHYPFASADSTNVARNHAGNKTRNTPRKDPVEMALAIDSRQCPAVWVPPVRQLTMEVA